MRIKIKRRELLLYIILFFAVFHDICRIPSSSVTFFRICTPLAIFAGFSYNFRRTLKYLIFFLLLIICNLIQAISFAKVNTIGIQVNASLFIKYAINYCSIFVVVIMVDTIYHLDRKNFLNNFRAFIKFLAWIILFFFFLHALRQYYSILNSLSLANVNNYGAYCAAILPFFIYEAFLFQRKRAIIYCILTILLSIANDCKLIFLGAAIEIVIAYFCTRKHRKGKFQLWPICILPILTIMAIFFICDDSITVMGYSFNGMVIQPVQRILKGQAFDISASSISFRVNVFIIGIQWLAISRFMGIGMGNTGILLKKVLLFKENSAMDIMDVLSPHNTIVELLLEFGFIAAMLYLMVITKLIKFIKMPKRKQIHNIFLIEFLSVWLWVLAPSSIHTAYFIHIVWSYLFLCLSYDNSTNG